MQNFKLTNTIINFILIKHKVAFALDAHVFNKCLIIILSL